VNLLQDDNTVGVRPAANRALCYAATVGSIPMMESLTQKGAGEALLQVFIQPTYVPETKTECFECYGIPALSYNHRILC